MLDTLEAFGFNPNKPTTFVGHSKGGAVVWIAARRMIDADDTRDIDVLTFAVPKVGDDRLVATNGLTHTRHVIHRQDVIPLVPPNAPIIPLVNFLLTVAQRDALPLWKNFPTYQITGDGWGNGMEAAEDLPWQTYAVWIQQLLRGQVPGAIAQHYLASYIAALADCCDEPKFPFSRRLWDKLFGDADLGEGGGMWGGGGDLKDTSAEGGLKIGGSGAILP